MSEEPKFEAPIQGGPLKNPEWTEEQNREYDITESRSTPELARFEALGGKAADTEKEFEKIAGKAKEIVEETSKSQQKSAASSKNAGRSKKPYRARFQDSTDRSRKQLDDVGAP